MQLEKLWYLYLSLAKKQAITLPDDSRIRACQWIKKLESAPSGDDDEKKLQLHALKLMLLSLERKYLAGPFEDAPEEKDFTEYDWGELNLLDFSDMVVKKERDVCGRSDTSFSVSGDRRESLTDQDDPATGQHCHYTCSLDPVVRWENLQGGAIRNDTISDWQEHGEWEVLNLRESQSSVEVPRCVEVGEASEFGFLIRVDQSNYSNQAIPPQAPPTMSPPRCDYTPERPATPRRLGGVAAGQNYGPEQFGLTQQEQFRSPRSVFQNQEYDQYQSPQRMPPPCRPPMSAGPRLSDEVRDSFENAMALQPPRSDEGDAFKQRICARVQEIRERMNQPKVEIEAAFEIEPDEYCYEPITLQEEYNDYQAEDDMQQLGILSAGEMEDEDMFGEDYVLDPTTIFKRKDEDLVTRSVVKIETNHKIGDTEREVTEELIEEEEMNVTPRRKPDENILDISEPLYSTPPPGYSPIRREELLLPPTRRVPADYTDLPCEDIDEMSLPSFLMESPRTPPRPRTPPVGMSPARQAASPCGPVYSPARQAASPAKQPASPCEPVCSPMQAASPSMQRVSPAMARMSPARPSGSQRMQTPSPGRVSAGFAGRGTPDRRSPQVAVCEPDFPEFEPTPPRRPLPLVDVWEQLSDVCEPEYAPEYAASPVRRTPELRPLPQVDVGERLSDVCEPEYAPEYEATPPRSPAMRSTPQRSSPKTPVDERLSDVCAPEYESPPGGYSPIRREDLLLPPVRRVPADYTDLPCEDIDEMSQPSFLMQSPRTPPTPVRPRTPPAGSPARSLASPFRQQVSPCRPATSPRGQVSPPSPGRQVVCPSPDRQVVCPGEEMASPGRRSASPARTASTPQRRSPDGAGVCEPDYSPGFQPTPPARPLPLVDVWENISDVCQPDFPPSFEDSGYMGSVRSSTPQRFDDVCGMFEESGQRERLMAAASAVGRRSPPQVDICERLSDVCEPEYAPEYEATPPRSPARRSTPRRSSPKTPVDERLSDVCAPEYESPPGGYSPIRREDLLLPPVRRVPADYTDLPCEDIDEMSQPSFLMESPRTPPTPVRPRTPPVGSPARSLASPFRQQVSPCRPASPDRQVVCPGEEMASPGRRSASPARTASTPQRRSPDGAGVCEPDYSPGFQPTPPARPLPLVDVWENISDVCQPDFPPSFEDSGYMGSVRPSTPQRFDDVCGMFEESGQRERLMAAASAVGRRSPPQVDICERLSDVCEPEYAPEYEATPPRSPARRSTPRRSSPKTPVDERLSDVCAPEYESPPGGYSPIRREDLLLPPVRRVPADYTDLPCEDIDEMSQPSFLMESPRTPPTPVRPRTPPAGSPARSLASPFRQQVSPCRPATSPRGQVSTPSPGRQVVCPSPDRQVVCPGEEMASPGRRSASPARTASTPQRRSPDGAGVCEPDYSPGFQPTPPARPLPLVDVWENISDVCQPDFPPSFEDSGYMGSVRPSTPQRFDDVCGMFEESGQRERLMAAASAVGRRSPPQVDICERLSDVCEPEYAPEYEATPPRSPARRSTPRRSSPKTPVDERLSDVCAPEYESPPGGYSPIRREDLLLPPVRRVPADYTDLPCEDIDEMSQPSFLMESPRTPPTPVRPRTPPAGSPARSMESPFRQQVSPCRPAISPREQARTPSPGRQVVCPSPGRQIVCPSPDRQVVCPGEEMAGPGRRSVSPGRTSAGRRSTSERRLPSGICEQDFRDGFQPTPPRRPLPLVDVWEQLSDVCEPEYAPEYEPSPHRKSPELRPLPQVDVGERLSDVCEPEYVAEYEATPPRSPARQSTPQRSSPKTPVDERLSDVCAPEYESPPGGYSPIRREDLLLPPTRRVPADYTDLPCEDIDEMSQPSFLMESPRTPRTPQCSRTPTRAASPCRLSLGREMASPVRRSESPARRSGSPSRWSASPARPSASPARRSAGPVRRSASPAKRSGSPGSENCPEPQPDCFDGFQPTPPRRPLPLVDVWEQLSDVCEPEFISEYEASPPRTTPKQTSLPQMDAGERLSNICQPEFAQAYEDTPRRGRRSATPPRRQLPMVDVTENLDDICEMEFAPSFEESPVKTAQSRPLPQVDIEERLSDICEPEYAPSFEGGFADQEEVLRSPPQSPRREGPQRMAFPRQDVCRTSPRRSGDFRKAFEGMPFYAPFEKQIAPDPSPIPGKAFQSRLKRPGTFGQSMASVCKMPPSAAQSRIRPPSAQGGPSPQPAQQPCPQPAQQPCAQPQSRLQHPQSRLRPPSVQPMYQSQAQQQRQPRPCPQPCPSTRQISPCPQPRQPSSCPQPRQPSPCPQSRQPSPCPQTRQPSPRPQTRQPSPCPQARQPSPCPQARQPSPCPQPRQASQPSPCPQLRQPSPCPQVREPSPCLQPSPRQQRQPSPCSQPSPQARQSPSPCPQVGQPSPCPHSSPQKQRQPSPCPLPQQQRQPSPCPQPQPCPRREPMPGPSRLVCPQSRLQPPGGSPRIPPLQPCPAPQSRLQPPCLGPQTRLQPPGWASQSRLQPPCPAPQSRLQPPSSASQSRLQPPCPVPQSRLQPQYPAPQLRPQPPCPVPQSRLQPPCPAPQSRLQPPNLASQSRLQPQCPASQLRLQPPGSAPRTQLQTPCPAPQTRLQPPCPAPQSRLQPPRSAQQMASGSTSRLPPCPASRIPPLQIGGASARIPCPPTIPGAQSRTPAPPTTPGAQSRLQPPGTSCPRSRLQPPTAMPGPSRLRPPSQMPQPTASCVQLPAATRSQSGLPRSGSQSNLQDQDRLSNKATMKFQSSRSTYSKDCGSESQR